MRKIVTIVVILVSQLVIDGCLQNEALFLDPPIDQILGGKEFVVYKGILTFKDKSTFNKLTEELIGKDETFIYSWEKDLGFKSLYTTYEDVIVEEDKFLETMVKKYGENSEATRNEFGYSKLTQEYLKKGTILMTDDGLLDMNVTTPSLAPLVNADGFVRVGNEIRQYKSDFLKVILDADYQKISRLDGIKESSNQFHIARVEKVINKISDASRTQALSSCESIVGSHRLISYEEKTYFNEGGVPCPVYRNDYYIMLRSLKKILGSWQNFRTSQFTITATYALNHLNCDYSVKTLVSSRTNHFWQIGGEWHTFSAYYVRNYDTVLA